MLDKNLKNFYLNDIYSKETLLKFLNSKNFSGIGKETAKKLINFFGEKLYDILKNENWIELKNSKIISLKIIDNLILKWTKIKIFFELHLLLYKYGLLTTSIKKLYNIYKNDTLTIIKNNPYFSMEKIGIGFKIADKFAKEINIDPKDHRRISAAFFFIIEENRSFGNTYIEKQNCINKINELTENEIEIELVVNEIEKLRKENKIIIIFYENENLIFLFHDLYCEQYISAFLKKNSKKNSSINLEKIKLDFKESNLDEIQKEALFCCFKYKMFLICGGAGTGKTTLIKHFYQFLENNNLTSTFCAPTGRAAQRIKEAVGCNAKTIHRTFGYKRISFSSKEKINYEQTIKTDFLIIDESSMLDIFVMYSILNSISEKTNIIFIGDQNQLPSISCGNIIYDILSKNLIPNIILKKIFRQSENNKIISASKAISDGIIPKLIESDNECSFFYRAEKEEGLSLIENIAKKNYDLIKKTPTFQFITHMNKGIFGTINLNKILQKIYSTKRQDFINKIINNWFVGDRVIQTKNNYNLEVFNGEIGIIIDGDFFSCTVQYDDRKIIYTGNSVYELSLAYAITIHKSQGSEFENICIPLYMEHYINFNRNSLYTAITRAKKNCIIVGDYKAFVCAIKKENSTRKTFLSLNY